MSTAIGPSVLRGDGFGVHPRGTAYVVVVDQSKRGVLPVFATDLLLQCGTSAGPSCSGTPTNDGRS